MQPRKATIKYFTLTDEMRKEEKLDWFRKTNFEDIVFETITPDKNNNWINLADDNDWESLMPVCSKDVKLGKDDKAIFKLFSLGISTNRDEWVYDFDKNNLRNKMAFFIENYNCFIDNNDNSWNTNIKWSRDLKNKFQKKQKIILNKTLTLPSDYRPYVKCFWYGEKILNDILTQTL